jgi:hypothetical protein
MGLGRLNPGCGCECDECSLTLDPCRLVWDCQSTTIWNQVRVRKNGVVIATSKSGAIGKPTAGTYTLDGCRDDSGVQWLAIAESVITPEMEIAHRRLCPQCCCEDLGTSRPSAGTLTGFGGFLQSLNGTYGLTQSYCQSYWGGASAASLIQEWMFPGANQKRIQLWTHSDPPTAPTGGVGAFWTTSRPPYFGFPTCIGLTSSFFTSQASFRFQYKLRVERFDIATAQWIDITGFGVNRLTNGSMQFNEASIGATVSLLTCSTYFSQVGGVSETFIPKNAFSYAGELFPSGRIDLWPQSLYTFTLG